MLLFMNGGHSHAVNMNDRCVPTRLLHVHGGFPHDAGTGREAAFEGPAGVPPPQVPEVLLPHVRLGGRGAARAPGPGRGGHVAMETRGGAERGLAAGRRGVPLGLSASGTIYIYIICIIINITYITSSASGTL